MHCCSTVPCWPLAAGMSPDRQWTCGQNCPLAHRGRNGEVCPKLRMVIANVLWNFHDKPELRRRTSRTCSAPGDATQNTKAYNAVARLTGLSPKKVFAIEAEIHRQGWVWNLRPQSQPSSGESARNTLCRPLATQEERGEHDFAAWLPPLGGDVPAIGGDVHSDVPAVGGDVHSGLPDLPKNDPAEEFLLDKQPVIDGDMPATGGVGLLPKWRAHPNYHISMRQAELATFWISAGLPDNRWPEFLTWFARTAPGVLGNVNHSWHWLREFGFSLTRTLLTNAAASLHCVVPALGMPSDYVRVIDVVTINQVSLLPIIEIHIGPDGKMRYTLVGCPALGNIHTHVAAAGGEGRRPLATICCRPLAALCQACSASTRPKSWSAWCMPWRIACC